MHNVGETLNNSYYLSRNYSDVPKKPVILHVDEISEYFYTSQTDINCYLKGKCII